ncbi:MAG: hypothetical protein A3G41_06495 [Elusimicrobia bacterium RIFCSPLOWO2_12_FULL_59_9]|nr:MAG: hypothetical protein A3G41_06495 [Elusimicrobia bacterium RIFCSPLOWO2_12_FULL_59_9]
MKLKFFPLTPERWQDFEALFGERGACGGCWCMWWRVPRAQWTAQKGEGNKKAFRKIVNSGTCPGLLAYCGGRPVAWCAVEPREAYPVLDRSPALKRVDDRPVWSVTCFFVAKPWRRKGLTVQLLRAAKRFVRERGGKTLEGYPMEPRKGKMPDAFAWTGLASAFGQAGFKEAARNGFRPILRCDAR